LRSTGNDPEFTGDLLTKTSERRVKKLILESLNNVAEHIQTMPNNIQDSVMMICYRECLSNLQKFNGGEEYKILQFINNIERIGKLIDANDDILHCMCTAKLDGEAKRWYEDNMSLTQWENLKSALMERFTTSNSSSKIFEQLKERKQKSDETITSYYDAIIKLCHEYDSSMSQKMMISWLENGIKESLKIQIKRQMKLLSESARTTQVFLKFAKDEEELQEENVPGPETAAPYVPYFANTVSTTLKQTDDIPSNASKNLYSPRATTPHESENFYQQRGKINIHPRIRYTPSQQRSFTYKPQSSTFHRNTQHIPLKNAASINSSETNTRPSNPCSICFLLTGTRDGGDSSNIKQNPSTTNFIPSKLSSPIFINVQVNRKQQHAIIDTGSAVTIINKKLLKNIHHKKFVYKQKLHKSANSTSINIIGEIQLEIKIQGYKTLILADVATNLITDLLLGNDWITENNVIIDSPRQCIFLIDKYYRTVATALFIKPTDLQLPVLLTDELTLPPYSEKLINVKTLSSMNNTTDALFEPAQNLYSKRILLTNAILKVENNTSQIMIINANDHQRTLSKNTKLGYISYQSELNSYLILPVLSEEDNHQTTQSKSFVYKRNNTRKSGSCDLLSQWKRKVQVTDFTCGAERYEEQHQCYVCQEQFLSRNDLQQHLRQKCYPLEMREQIDKLTQHIEDTKQWQQVQHILWQHGKLFDFRQPSIIKATVHHAIETGHHPPVHTPPYRVSYKDEQVQREEINKLLKQGVIEESTSPWSSPIVLVRKKDGSVRFCIDFRKLNNITTKDAFPIPRIDDIFDQLSQAEYYSTIDFKSGYFQVGLDPRDRPKTAFSTRDQHYQFTVLPQGVTNGPPAFQRIVSQILGPTRWKYSLAYLDDVIIYSSTFDQHLIHLDDILNRLNV
ncbi:unnamed protein product, partial [Rotaria sp. Silwood2]